MFVSASDYTRFSQFINVKNHTINQCHENAQACYEEKYSSWDEDFFLPHWSHEDDIFFAIEGYDKRGDFFIHEGRWPGASRKD